MAILKHQCECGNDSYEEIDGYHTCANCRKVYRKVRETKFAKEVKTAMEDG